jgi:hypothetical protein
MMRMILLTGLAATIGVAAGITVAAFSENLMSDQQAYVRDCLPGDECTMTIRPKGAPWLNVTCELTQPPRCRDE